MNDKVYVITKGNYSDYHICAVTLDKDRAQKLKKLYSDRRKNAEIEEYVPNEAKPMFMYGVEMDTSGKVLAFKADEYDLHDDGYAEAEFDLDSNSWRHVVWVNAKDEAHAVKIAQDRLAEYKAKKAGIV